MSDGMPSRYVASAQKLTGGIGEVVIAKDQDLDREVAIKFIQDTKDQRRLFDEIHALQRIRSKHVVQVFDVFFRTSDRKMGIVQEYVPGEDLSNVIFSSLDEYMRALYQISAGISDIHSQGLIHRDIKPNNMKFDRSGIIKIFDFGLARFTGKDDSTLGFSGTPGFAAPELYNSGSVAFTESVDTYAFGILAWLLSGEDLPQNLLRRPPDLSQNNSFSDLPLDLPQPVINILDQTVSESIENRPRMYEVRDALGKYLLRNKHRALIVHNNKTYTLEEGNRRVRLNVSESGSLTINYDGLNFIVEDVRGSVFVNNSNVYKGAKLPGNCVITLGDGAEGSSKRVFITFDISNPEVVL